jgi:hypothetical protein
MTGVRQIGPAQPDWQSAGRRASSPSPSLQLTAPRLASVWWKLPHDAGTPVNRRDKGNVMSARKRLLAVAAAVAMWATLQPGAASAQIIGLGGGNIGGDGYTRAMWHGTDGSISVWKLDPALNVVGTHNYGPYPGWSPASITTNGNDNTYVLWRYTDGTANIWELDANLNYVTSRTFGPIAGWTPEWLGIDYYGYIRLLWTSTASAVSAWQITPGTLIPTGSVAYGPYFGWSF